MKYFITSRNPSKLYCLVKGCSTEVNSLSHTNFGLMVIRLIRRGSAFACRRASEGCQTRYHAWLSLFSRRLLAIGLSSSSISKNKHSIPKRPAVVHNNCRFQEAEKVSCFDTPAGAKEVSAVKIMAAFKELKSCFEEFLLTFATSQND